MCTSSVKSHRTPGVVIRGILGGDDTEADKKATTTLACSRCFFSITLFIAPNLISPARPFRPQPFCHFETYPTLFPSSPPPPKHGSSFKGGQVVRRACLTMSESFSKRSANTSSDAATCSSMRGISRSMRSSGAANGDFDGICDEAHHNS